MDRQDIAEVVGIVLLALSGGILFLPAIDTKKLAGKK
jgi:hypothetical protein